MIKIPASIIRRQNLLWSFLLSFDFFLNGWEVQEHTLPSGYVDWERLTWSWAFLTQFLYEHLNFSSPGISAKRGSCWRSVQNDLPTMNRLSKHFFWLCVINSSQCSNSNRKLNFQSILQHKLHIKVIFFSESSLVNLLGFFFVFLPR